VGELERMWTEEALPRANRAKLDHFLKRAEESPQAPDCQKHAEDEEAHLYEFLCKLVLYAPEEWYTAASGLPCPATAKNDFKVIGVAFDASSRLRRAGIDFFHWRLTKHLCSPGGRFAGYPQTGYVLYLGAEADGLRQVCPVAELPKRPPSSVRLVAVSDTHHFHGSLALPEGDILCHAGDLSYEESRSPDAARFEEYLRSRQADGAAVDGRSFHEWLVAEKLDLAESLKWLGTVGCYKHRLLIGGNHDYILDAIGETAAEGLCRAFEVTYLHTARAPVKLEGLSLWGSGVSFAAGLSATRAALSGNRAFQLDEARAEEWAREVGGRIQPGSVDVVLTHMPVEGLLGKAGKGSEALNKLLEHLKPKLYICGHAHHPADPLKDTWKQMGEGVGVNAACLGVWNQLHGLPVVVDLPAPAAGGVAAAEEPEAPEEPAPLAPSILRRPAAPRAAKRPAEAQVFKRPAVRRRA